MLKNVWFELKTVGAFLLRLAILTVLPLIVTIATFVGSFKVIEYLGNRAALTVITATVATVIGVLCISMAFLDFRSRRKEALK